MPKHRRTLNNKNVQIASFIFIITFAFIGYLLLKPSQAINADIDGSGSVDSADLAILVSNFGRSGMTFTQGDITLDGKVDGFDGSTLLANWGGGGTNNYYIDCNLGSDTNSGKTQNSAWKTLTKANSSSLVAGDNLLLKRGCVWQGNLTVKWSGTSASYITIDAYGSGSAPQITRNTNGADITVTGSYTVIQNLDLSATPPTTISASDPTCPNAPFGNIQGISYEANAANNIVRNTTISSMYAGVFLKAGAHNNHVLNNTLTNNNMMSPLDTVSDNDAGAFGILIWGNNNEVAHNTVTGSNACSYDYVLDGSAIEIYGGSSTLATSNNIVHHNLAVNDNAFTELGKSSSAPSPDNNIYAYNIYTASGINNSIFLVTRGYGDNFGPMTHTKFYNNTAYMVGTTKNGIYCGGTCNLSGDPSNVLTFKNNIIATNNNTPIPTSYAADFSNNIGWVIGSTANNPKFVSAPSDLHLLSGSLAIDAGTIESVNASFNLDFDNISLPVGPAVDIGAYEFH